MKERVQDLIELFIRKVIRVFALRKGSDPDGSENLHLTVDSPGCVCPSVIGVEHEDELWKVLKEGALFKGEVST